MLRDRITRMTTAIVTNAIGTAMYPIARKGWLPASGPATKIRSTGTHQLCGNIE